MAISLLCQIACQLWPQSVLRWIPAGVLCHRWVADAATAKQPEATAGTKPSGKLPGAFVVAQQTSLFEQGLAAGRAIDIEITGPVLERLVALGGSIMGGELDNQRPPVGIVAGLRDESGKPVETAQARPIPSLDLSSPEVHITPRRLEAAELSLNATDLGYAINALVDGAYAADYFLKAPIVGASLE